MRHFEFTNTIHFSVFMPEIDNTMSLSSDLRRVLGDVLADMELTGCERWRTVDDLVFMSHPYALLPTFNHDPETQGLYEYDPDRDCIVLNSELDHLWEERVAYRVIYCAILERQFFLDQSHLAQEKGLAGLFDDPGFYEEKEPWLPGLARLVEQKSACRIPAEEVWRWRDQYQDRLVWDDPDKVMARRALMHAIVKEHREERAYLLEHHPELLETEKNN